LCDAFLHLKRISKSTRSQSENAVTKKYLSLVYLDPYLRAYLFKLPKHGRLLRAM